MRRLTVCQRGSVTAELAVGLVGLVLVLAAVLGAAAVAVAQVRVTDAARAGARAAARAEPAAVVSDVARRAAGQEVSVRVRRSGGVVHVRVSGAARLALPGRPAVPVTATAAVPVEGRP
ncbi:MAG: TadE family type IV pilus minor pilin [Actinomycetes bacterium]